MPPLQKCLNAWGAQFQNQHHRETIAFGKRVALFHSWTPLLPSACLLASNILLLKQSIFPANLLKQTTKSNFLWGRSIQRQYYVRYRRRNPDSWKGHSRLRFEFSHDFISNYSDIRGLIQPIRFVDRAIPHNYTSQLFFLVFHNEIGLLKLMNILAKLFVCSNELNFILLFY